MPMIDAFLAELQHEAATTRRRPRFRARFTALAGAWVPAGICAAPAAA